MSPSMKALALYLKGRCFSSIAFRLDADLLQASLDSSPTQLKAMDVEAVRREFRSAFSKAEKCFLDCIDIYRSTGTLKPKLLESVLCLNESDCCRRCCERIKIMLSVDRFIH